MPKILATLLLLLVEPVVSRVVSALGFGLVTYTGVSFVLDKIEQQLTKQVGSLTSDIFQFLALLGFGQAMTVLLSAVLIRAYLSGMTGAGNVVRSRFMGN